MGLFYTKVPKFELTGYANASYLSDHHYGRSQIDYLLTCGGTTISWRSIKQTISGTSSNHVELLVLHEESRQCVWLRSLIQHIQDTCGLSSGKTDTPAIYDDNSVYIAQLKCGYIKGDRTKPISLNFFPLMTFKRSVI